MPASAMTSCDRDAYARHRSRYTTQHETAAFVVSPPKRVFDYAHYCHACIRNDQLRPVMPFYTWRRSRCNSASSHLTTMEGPVEELPVYSPRTGTTESLSEHRYALRDKNGHDKLSLHFRSRATNPKHTPLFLEGDTIRGEVRLDLAKAETLKGITITVRYTVRDNARRLHFTSHFFVCQIRGATTAIGLKEEVFLNKLEPVWTPASPQEGKVIGVHTHAFSISIPPDVEVTPAAPKATPKRFPLPPTFSERASPAYIDYKVCVIMRRGGLRVNDQCASIFILLLQQLFEAVVLGYQRTSRSYHTPWLTHHPPCALLCMLRVAIY